MERIEFPKWKYHPAKPALIVDDEGAERALGAEWADSPAHFGVETCPGLEPDPVIAAKKRSPAAVLEMPKKPGRPKKVAAPEGDSA